MTKRCASCGEKMEVDASFCTRCGKSLAKSQPPANGDASSHAQPVMTSCSTCGGKLEAGARFCTQCGVSCPLVAVGALTQSKPTDAGDRAPLSPATTPRSEGTGPSIVPLAVIVAGGTLLLCFVIAGGYFCFLDSGPSSLSTPAAGAGSERCDRDTDAPSRSPSSSTLVDPSPVKESGPDDIPFKKKVIDEQSVEIAAPVGGSVELKNGFRVVLPPGALARDATVRVRRGVVRAEDASVLQGFEYYRIDVLAAGSKLARPATLRFPLQKDDDPDAIVLVHYRDDGSSEVICHSVTEPGFVQAQVDSFSVVMLLGGAIGTAVGAYLGDTVGPRLAAADEAIANHEKKIIHVPYYAQYDFSWCWAASAAMLFGAQGAQVQPHEVGHMFEAIRTQGGCFWPRAVTATFGGDTFDFDVIRRKLTLPEMRMNTYGLGGAWEKSLRGWLIQQIRAGQPVWLGLRRYDGTSDHAVMVVGYDHVGFYIHDPSGALIAQLEVMRGHVKDKKDAAVDQHGMAFCRVRFDEWQKILYPGWFQYRPWLTNVGVIEKRADAPRTVTMQIPTGSCSDGSALTFHRDGFSFAILSEVIYYWNGQQPGGCGFSVDCVDANDKQNAARMGRDGLCNSDALHLLKVEVHNTGSRPFEGRIRLTLDGESVATQDPALQQIVRVQPSRTREPHVVAEIADRAKSTDPGKGSYTTAAARRNMSLADALNFMANPLHLGKHTLAVELTDGAGGLLDRSVVHFEMHPAVPRAVEAAAKTSRGTGALQVVHEITWGASPEEKRGGVKGRYCVYRLPLRDQRMEHAERVATVNAGTYRAEVPAPKGERVRYSVSYVDAGSDYESPLAQPSVPVSDEAKPDFEIEVQFSNTWRKGPLQAGVKLVPADKRNPWAVLPQPYLVVVAVGGHKQYLYPANAIFPGAKAGWTGSQGVSRFGGMHIRMLQPEAIAANTMTVTVVLGDGTRMSREVPVPFQAEAQPDWAGEKLVYARGKLAQAEALPRTDEKKKEYRARMIVYAYAEILKYTSAREEANAVLEKANAVLPETDARFQKGLLRALQDAQMQSAWLRGDVGLYQSIVTEWEKTDSVDAHTYLTLIQMLIMDANNVSAAHAYWPRFKAAAAKMSAAEQKRFHYDEYIKQPLLLPPQAISASSPSERNN